MMLLWSTCREFGRSRGAALGCTFLISPSSWGSHLLLLFPGGFAIDLEEGPTGCETRHTNNKRSKSSPLMLTLLSTDQQPLQFSLVYSGLVYLIGIVT